MYIGRRIYFLSGLWRDFAICARFLLMAFLARSRLLSDLAWLTKNGGLDFASATAASETMTTTSRRSMTLNDAIGAVLTQGEHLRMANAGPEYV